MPTHLVDRLTHWNDTSKWYRRFPLNHSNTTTTTSSSSSTIASIQSNSLEQKFRVLDYKERHRRVWACGCCKKEFLNKEELTDHMRDPDHEKSLTYVLASYNYGEMIQVP